MIGHNIRLGRLHIRKVPLNILTNGLSIKSHQHNILSRAISIITVYLNNFINLCTQYKDTTAEYTENLT